MVFHLTRRNGKRNLFEDDCIINVWRKENKE